ncbi:unnamed protein product [Chilo suppressalis]|uniref:C2 domain-containing protein n=1 Tax=Chilo suppressalis TaxID=168631 RepID=A0ABN8BFZ9_CHISP|nr:unnamed protein product [Chilo suppressalis]
MKEINSNGFNMADDTRKVRVEERLKIKIGEAKNLPRRSHGGTCDRDIYCVLSLDQEEIFRTSTMERTLNPFFGEEFQFEVPRRFRYLSIYVFDRDKHLKQDKVLGKVAIKREDLHLYKKDHWFALRPVDADSEVQGKAHIELSLEDSRKRLRMEPKPPDPADFDNNSSKLKGNNLVRLSEYCKESIKFGSCSSSTSKKLLSSVATEPSLALSRSESLKDRAQWGTRNKPPMHAMSESDALPSPTAADYWSDPERHCAARVGPDTLRLRVLECSELTTKNGQCDPFALVTLLYSNGRKVEKRTKPRKKTVNPQFDDIFRFDLVMDADPKDKDSSQSAGVACEARVSVWHDAATPVFLGEVRLQLRQTAPSPLRAWFFLTSRAGGALSRGATPPGTRLSAGSSTLGSLRLLLQYTVDHVFPLDHYRKLEELFLRSVHQKPITASAVYILGEIVSSKNDAAQPLVRLFTHHDLIVPIVKELADSEISALTDATTIFRGNTLVSKMMDETMRLTGASYLRGVLRPTLAAVLAEKRPCEIDPTRVKPSAAISTNLANLKDYVERALDMASKLSNNVRQPWYLIGVSIDATVSPGREEALRDRPHVGQAFCGSIHNLAHLKDYFERDPQTNRTLTLISKTIQSLGNLVSSRSAQQVCKEEYMAELYRSFCTPRHVQAIRQFLEIISTSTETQNNNIQETPILLKEGRLFLSGVLAVAAVNCLPAGAPLGANNIFQIGCGATEGSALALRLDPARDLQRLHALLVQHAQKLDERLLRPPDGTSIEEREAEASTLKELQEAIFDLEHRHRTYRRSLARETKYGSKQAPIGDDNYLHLAGAAGNVDSDFHWRPWRSDTSPTIDLDGKSLPMRSSFDIGSSTESVRLGRHGDERSSGKSNKSTTSGYLTMSCLKHEPSEDSDASADKPARPPKPARLSPARAPGPLCEYVEVEPRPPERKPKPDTSPPKRPDAELEYRCKEYELMTNFMSHARAPAEEAPPAVPPRGHTAARARLHPKPPDLDTSRPLLRSPSPHDTRGLYQDEHSHCGSTTSLPSDSARHLEPDRPHSKIDTVSNDDSLLDELQRDTYCVLKVCEDDTPEEESNETGPDEDDAEKKDHQPFSRSSMKRKSNPIKSQTNAAKPLKTSNSTSNVHDAAGSSSRPFTDRLTPFFRKKKKPPEEQVTGKCARKEDNLIGRLTPRFGQSRLYGRGQSLELASEGGRGKRIERSPTAVSMPTRPINSSIVANLKFLSLHRYGAQEEVQCRGFVRTGEPPPPPPVPHPAEPAPAPALGRPCPCPSPPPDALEPAWRRTSLLATAPNDIRL